MFFSCENISSPISLIICFPQLSLCGAPLSWGPLWELSFSLLFSAKSVTSLPFAFYVLIIYYHLFVFFNSFFPINYHFRRNHLNNTPKNMSNGNAQDSLRISAHRLYKYMLPILQFLLFSII